MSDSGEANPELRDAAYAALPVIDELLIEWDIPIHKRFYLAAKIFIEDFTESISHCSKDEFIKSEAFGLVFLPIFNDWYWDKYGELAKGPGGDIYSGVVLAYNTPVKILIPATTSKVIESGKLAELTFPDKLEDDESIPEMLQIKFDLDKMNAVEREEFEKHVGKIVSLIRSLNIDLNMASNLPPEAEKLSKGIWSHMEKAAEDILTFKTERASIACWDIHLAVEKSLKVLLQEKTKKLEHGHDLKSLARKLSQTESDFNELMFEKLPSGKEAIKLRYAELVRTPSDAVRYYHESLELIADLANRLEHKLGIKNASITLKPAPWAR